MKSKTSLLLFFVLSTMGHYLQAGLQVTMDHQGDEEISYYQDGKSAIWSNGAITLLSNAKTGMVYEFNHSHEVYSCIKIAEIAGKMEALASQQMEAMKVSPFYLQLLENQKKEAAAHKIEVKAAGSKTIAGIKAEVFQILKDGEIVKTMWVSEALDKRIESEFPEAQFRSAFTKGEQIIREAMGSDPMWEVESKIEASGTVVYEMEKDMFFGEEEVNRELISIEDKKLDSSLFEIPEGYEEIDYDSFMQLEGDDEDYDSGEDTDGWE